jgi:hypothetical protein
MNDVWQWVGIAVIVVLLGYIVVTTWFDDSINSRGTTRNRGISGERGDEYRDRNAAL